MTARFIEINPFNQKTDPGLYDWNGGANFDGHMRYRNGAGQLAIKNIRSVLIPA